MTDLFTPRPDAGQGPLAGLRPPGMSPREAGSVLQWLRDGAYDETIKLELPPDLRSTISPLITAVRWGSLLFGMVYAATQAANDGNLWVVASLTIIMFITIWRTFRPLRLAWEGTVDRLLPVTDGLLIGTAAGLSAGFDSPFIYCVLAAIVIGALGWGALMGIAVLAVSGFAMLVFGNVSDAGFNLSGGSAWGVLFSMAFFALAISFVRRRLIETETRRESLTGQLRVLGETNALLGILNEVARTLPSSLDLRETLQTTRRQLNDAFGATSMALFTRDDHNNTWVPQITEGRAFLQSTKSTELPSAFGEALLTDSTVMLDEPGERGINLSSRSGLYTPLRSRGQVIGLLGVEANVADRYSDRDRRILEGLGEALGLTLDNARRFGRLRSIGADEERMRIARDLHDRLAQWLAYISFELERIMMTDETPSPDLESLHVEVQGAIEELRETLRQLRTGVSADNPLSKVIPETMRRFSQRSGVEVSYRDLSNGESLGPEIENELLRIVQESLNNVHKHAQASEVSVVWQIANGMGELRITDNGRGFNTSGAQADSSYGLVGMRERAEVIDAGLDIQSEPGIGTTICVTVSPEEARL